MSTDVLVMIVSIAAALVLAVRGLRSYDLGRNRTLAMAGIWVMIIAGVASLIQQFI